MRRITFASVGLAVFAVLVFGQMTFAADMLSGNWKLNLAKSKYSPANLTPKGGSTTKIETVQNGTKLVNDGVDSQNRKTHLEYTVVFDGKDVPVKATIDGKPSPDQDAIAWTKIDDYTYQNTAKLKGAGAHNHPRHSFPRWQNADEHGYWKERSRRDDK